MSDPKKIIIVSDGTGKTAKRLMDAVLSQYSDQTVSFSLENIYQEIRNKKRAREILKNINKEFLVIFSIISDDLRKFFHENLHDREILHLDVLEPMLKTMSKFLGVHPNYQPGLLQIIDDRYYRKVDAIGYTVEHDDGRGYQLPGADLILLGPSRTCKTPISMYLACNHGLKVANIPIIANNFLKEQLLKRLAGIDREKFFGLAMKPEILASVRMERSKNLALDKLGQESLEKYSNLDEIKYELNFCKQLFDELDIEIIDVTRRAIEEVSFEILRKAGYSETGF